MNYTIHNETYKKIHNAKQIWNYRMCDANLEDNVWLNIF